MRNRLLHLLIIVTLSLLALGAISGAGAPAFGADCGGATPCSCGDNVVASRTLVCGVDPVTTTICTGVGLFVTTANVTLNLGFCTIRGDGGDEIGDDGVVIGGANNVVVQSGRITGFDFGVTGSGPNTLITGLNIYENRLGIVIGGSGGVTVKNNLVRLNNPLKANLGGGMIVVGSGGNTVSGNRFENNNGWGASVLQTTTPPGDANKVTGNFSQRNTGRGFIIQGQGATVKQNRAKYNELQGFWIIGTGHVVTLNEAHANGTDGFLVEANGSMFDRNRSDSNGDFGIREGGGAGNTYSANRCTGNGDGPSSPAGLCR